MDNFQYLLNLYRDPSQLVQMIGMIGIICIVFAETGLLIGFFLPGDSLLVVAGLFAARGNLSLNLLLLFVSLAAIIGDAVGFQIGKKLGHLLYNRKDSVFFKKKHILAAHDFYKKHGGKTIIIARFIPIIRTFVPTVAGAAEMPYIRFAVFNVVGAFLWVWTMLLGGYFLGRIFGEKINSYIHILVILIILLSVLPIFIKWLKIRKENYSKKYLKDQ